MEMYYLLITISGTVVIPEQYSKSQCENIEKSYKNSPIGAMCIPAPRSILCSYNIPNTNQAVSIPCGVK